MPSFPFTFSIDRFTPLPGLAILRVSPAEPKHGSLHLPENAAVEAMQREPLREGRVVKVNARIRDTEIDSELHLFTELDVAMLRPGVRVWYLSRLDEVDNECVVVRIGQIVAVHGGDLDLALIEDLKK